MAAIGSARGARRSAAYRRRGSGRAPLPGLAVAALIAVLGWGALGLPRSWAAPAIDRAAGPPSGTAPPVGITYRRPAADGALISPESARQSVRRFSGREDLALEGGLERGPARLGDYAIFYLEARDGGAGEHSYKVDARTAEVLEMTRLDRRAAPGTGGGPGPLEAERRAERFIADRFLGFETLQLIERRVTPAADADHLFVFRWALVAPESGAWLPTSATVALT